MELNEVLIAHPPEQPQSDQGKILEPHFASNVFHVARALCIDIRSPGTWRVFNGVVTSVMFFLATYTIGYNIRITFLTRHLSAELAAQLLVILWAIQSLISMGFLVYWQLYGHLSEFRAKLALCQGMRGLTSERGQKYGRRTNRFFFVTIFLTCSITAAFATKYHTEERHTEFQERQSYIFYYPSLRPIYTLITTYLYIVFNMTLFVLILYTNSTYLEMRHFNEEISEYDGSRDEKRTTKDLLDYLRVYSDLCTAIRQLDLIFRLYTFIMIVITIPSMIFTLMMMNHRIHSLLDLLLCMPTIALCAFSFFAVTIAPARLHDEITRTKGHLCQNRSIWFPYRKEVYLIANTLSTHMEQFDLGVSVWGFALLSRPLILGTLSATAMMLSLLTELAPKAELLNE